MHRTVRRSLAILFPVILAGLLIASLQFKPKPPKEWPVYGGGSEANRYSALNQINTKNVNKLEVAWTFHTGDNKPDSAEIQCSPIVVDGLLYATSPKLKVIALDAATGKLRWSYDPFKAKNATVHANRGVVYWREGNDRRILFTAGPYLHALNALTGQPITEFGENGQVDLRKELDQDVSGKYLIATTPGIVYKNLLILGSRVSEGPDAAPGHVRAFDIRTGKRAWIFHTIPQPGELGYDTWEPESYKEVGGANSWSGFSLDEKRGMLFVPTGSPAYDFYGGQRKGANLFGNCVLALNAETGKYIWHFQTVHHDLWDRDLPCQPVLMTVKHEGKKVDAVAQCTKSGMVFLLDRETGKPLFPVEERPVPTSDMPGEMAWPTQPYPVKPVPFARQLFTENEVTNISPETHAKVLKRYKEVRSEHMFTPPSKPGTVILPGFDGGAEWGGSAVDPQKGILYVNSNEMPWILTMIDISERFSKNLTEGNRLYNLNCSPCHGLDRMGDQHQYPSLVGVDTRLKKEEIHKILANGRGRMPSFAHITEKDRNQIVAFLLNENVGNASARKDPEAGPAKPKVPFSHTGYHRFLDPDGYPAIKPPWGTLNAIDMNKGDLLWQVTLGEFPELTKRGIPPTGTENYGGPILTKGGLLFIGATKDRKFRAFDQQTGKVLWETTLPAGGYATPCTYEVNGKQYVVIAAGGVKMNTRAGDAYVAFALPD